MIILILIFTRVMATAQDERAMNQDPNETIPTLFNKLMFNNFKILLYYIILYILINS